ncbi:MAG: hypothetical protein V5789_00705 [Colwellia sp.]
MLKKIPYSHIDTITRRYKLSEAAKAILVNTLTPEQAITALVNAKLYNDAVQFIAHALPVMEAILWATESLTLRSEQWSELEHHAIDSAKNWLKKPNETLRIRASQLAERVGLESAPAWVAKAVYWSGTGSIVAPELPTVMPPAFLYAHSVAATITIAAAVPQWAEGDMGYQEFYLKVINKGLAIAKG